MEEDDDDVDRDSAHEKNVFVNKCGKRAHKIDSATFKCFCVVRTKEVSLVKIILQLQHKHD